MNYTKITVRERTDTKNKRERNKGERKRKQKKKGKETEKAKDKKRDRERERNENEKEWDRNQIIYFSAFLRSFSCCFLVPFSFCALSFSFSLLYFSCTL